MIVKLKGRQADFPMGALLEICLASNDEWMPDVSYEGGRDTFTLELQEEDARRAMELFPDKLTLESSNEQ